MSASQKGYVFFLPIFLISILPSKIKASLRTEAEALVKWKGTLSLPLPPSLSSWSLTNSSNLCNNWEAVVCDKTNTTVTEINLSNSYLEGTLTHFDFDSLPNLTTLNLNTNSLSWPIPSAVGNLTKLTYLDLGNNLFEGILPSEIGQLKEIQYLSLFNNNFSGTIPYQLTDLPKLWYLELSANYFASPPDWSYYSGLSSLTHLSLSYNNFTSEFPTFILECQNLTFLDLSQNLMAVPKSLYIILVKLE